jgi:hypothetical protein
MSTLRLLRHREKRFQNDTSRQEAALAVHAVWEDVLLSEQVTVMTKEGLEIIDADIVRLVEGCRKCGNKIAFFRSLTTPQNPDLDPTIVWICMNCSASIEIKAKNSKELCAQIETWISEELPEKGAPAVDFGTFFDTLVQAVYREGIIGFRKKLRGEKPEG